MKIDVTEDSVIRLTEVYNGVLFEADKDETLAVCMRDGGFEIGISGLGDKKPTWYVIKGGEISLLARPEDMEAPSKMFDHILTWYNKRRDQFSWSSFRELYFGRRL